MDISIVIPLYNEEESLPQLIAWIDKVMAEKAELTAPARDQFVKPKEGKKVTPHTFKTIVDKKTKEMLGLVASMVLRCDDCIKYHLGKCHEEGITTAQMYEIFAVANIVGGTIVIPHTRRAAEYWEELTGNDQ